jgi:type II secretory pathway component GspD/PulD (secretin)
MILVVVALTSAQELKDIKFYNLEKEYSRTVTYVYKVKNAQALELKQIVSGMLSIYGSLYVNEKTNELYITDTEEKITDLKNVVPGLDIKELKAGNNLVSRLVYLKHENMSEVSGIIQHKLSPDGSVYEVPHLNALVITDVSSKIDEVAELLSLIDVFSPHIAIEITVVEFNNEYFSKLGINVFNWLQGLSIEGEMFDGGDGDRRGSVSLHSRTEPASDGIKSSTSLTPRDTEKAFYLRGGIAVADLVNFISENADGSVLASTRIITRNNKAASIDSREIIPYRFYENDAMHAYPYSTTLNTVSAGISVKVVPTLQQDSLINLHIIPRISDLTGWSPKGMPIIFERSLNTEVKVKENTVFVLGGLKKKETVETRKGIPGLKEIPVIRYLFSVKTNIVLEREVLIFIRPTTMTDGISSAQEVKGMMEKHGKGK